MKIISVSYLEIFTWVSVIKGQYLISVRIYLVYICCPKTHVLCLSIIEITCGKSLFINEITCGTNLFIIEITCGTSPVTKYLIARSLFPGLRGEWWTLKGLKNESKEKLLFYAWSFSLSISFCSVIILLLSFFTFYLSLKVESYYLHVFHILSPCESGK